MGRYKNIFFLILLINVSEHDLRSVFYHFLYQFCPIGPSFTGSNTAETEENFIGFPLNLKQTNKRYIFMNLDMRHVYREGKPPFSVQSQISICP